MKQSWLWVLLVLSLGVNIGVLATIGVARGRAQQRWERPTPFQGERAGPPMHLLDRIADHLALEGEQREQFKELQSAFFQETKGQQNRLMELRLQLRDELAAEYPDRERIESLLSQLGSVYVALDRALVENMTASREILDEKQQKRYLRIVDRIRGASMGGSQRGGPPGRPARQRPPG